MKEYATIKIVDDQCKLVRGAHLVKAFWDKEQYDRIACNVEKAESAPDCCNLFVDEKNTGSVIVHKDNDVYRVHKMLLTVPRQSNGWAPRFRCQPGIALDDCKSCAEMMAKGKCVDARMREIVGAVLYPHFYTKMK